MKTFGFLLATVVGLAGCASTYDMNLMPRQSGKIYIGTASKQGVEINIEGEVFRGSLVKVGSNERFGFSQKFATINGAPVQAFSNSYQSGDAFAKGLLASAEGHGLRCDIRFSGRSGGGICLDDKEMVYDLTITRKR